MSRPKHSKESLVVAASFTTSMTEFLHALELEPTPGRRAAMWARLGHLGIDTSHWVRSAHGSRRYSTETLAAVVADSRSIAEVLRKLGIRPAGGSHFHISNRIKREGLDTSHFLGQGHNRGKPGRRKPASEVLVVLTPGSQRRKRGPLVRAMLEVGVPYRCAVCGVGAEWLGRPLTLAVDHVNGDWLDNRLVNLRFLCPNCHAQTSTWCRQKPSLNPLASESQGL